jgi:energy-coupling factor transporter ATP-binding protein EcfA2
MKLKAIVLKNFRAYKGEITIPVDDLTVLVGRNDIGKSSILESVGIFLEASDLKLDAGDRCVHTSDTEVRIGLVFTDLPSSLVLDASTSTTLGDEYLLNTGGDLEVHRIWQCKDGKATAKPTVAIALHPSSENSKDLLQLKHPELKARAKQLGIDVDDRRVSSLTRRAIWQADPSLGLVRTEVPLDKEDAKVIYTKLQSEMPSFALFRVDRSSNDEDPEVQDPMKFAIVSAISGLGTELAKVKAMVEEKATDVTNRTLVELKKIDPTLASELKPNFKGEPKWEKAFTLSLTSDDQIPLNKRGSGFRRLILLSFFRAEAVRVQEELGKQNIIYAIEEPEASQHPHSQMMLINAFRDLAATDGCQVMLTTHVPALAGQLPAENIRHIRKDNARNMSIETGGEAMYAHVTDDMGIIPDGRVQVIVCVEGPHDVRWLQHMSEILRQEDATLPDLRDDRRIVLIPLGGSTLKDWANNHYLRRFNLPEIHIYDRGADNPPKYQAQADTVNARGGDFKAFLTSKSETENYLHGDAILKEFGVNVTVTDTLDVPAKIAQVLHDTDASRTSDWATLDDDKKKKKESRAKVRLNDAAAEAMTVKMLEDRAAKDEIVGWLRTIDNLLT